MYATPTPPVADHRAASAALAAILLAAVLFVGTLVGVSLAPPAGVGPVPGGPGAAGSLRN